MPPRRRKRKIPPISLGVINTGKSVVGRISPTSTVAPALRLLLKKHNFDARKLYGNIFDRGQVYRLLHVQYGVLARTIIQAEVSHLQTSNAKLDAKQAHAMAIHNLLAMRVLSRREILK